MSFPHDSPNPIWDAYLSRATTRRDEAHAIIENLFHSMMNGESSTNRIEPLYHQGQSIALPETNNDPLFQNMAVCVQNVDCTICQRDPALNVRLGYMIDEQGRSQKTLQREFTHTTRGMTACGHCFHETCLYSLLSEPYPPTGYDCPNCLAVREAVMCQGWNMNELEVAIWRVQG